MESVLVHLYQRDNNETSNHEVEIYGVVEFIDGKTNLPFKNQNELWSILTSHVKELEKENHHAS